MEKRGHFLCVGRGKEEEDVRMGDERGERRVGRVWRKRGAWVSKLR
jgi:hypothetical protein